MEHIQGIINFAREAGGNAINNSETGKAVAAAFMASVDILGALTQRGAKILLENRVFGGTAWLYAQQRGREVPVYLLTLAATTATDPRISIAVKKGLKEFQNRATLDNALNGTVNLSEYPHSLTNPRVPE